MNAKYVYVNWSSRDIVSTTSYPGEVVLQNHNAYGPNEPGKLACSLYKAGYVYYGYFTGFNVSNIQTKK